MMPQSGRRRNSGKNALLRLQLLQIPKVVVGDTRFHRWRDVQRILRVDRSSLARHYNLFIVSHMLGRRAERETAISFGGQRASSTARPPEFAAHAGFRICPATLLISSLRSASSVFPATQEMAFDNRHMLLPAGMFTVSAEL